MLSYEIEWKLLWRLQIKGSLIFLFKPTKPALGCICFGYTNRVVSIPNDRSSGSVGLVSLLSDLRFCNMSRVLIYSPIDNIVQQCCFRVWRVGSISVCRVYTQSIRSRQRLIVKGALLYSSDQRNRSVNSPILNTQPQRYTFFSDILKHSLFNTQYKLFLLSHIQTLIILNIIIIWVIYYLCIVFLLPVLLQLNNMSYYNGCLY